MSIDKDQIDKEQFDALIKLAEFRRGVRDGRRQIEWKFTATAFAALAGLSVVPDKAPLYVVIVAVISICILHTLWVYWNMSRTNSDRAEMYHYKDKAEKFLPTKLRYCDPEGRVPGPLSFLPFIFQVLTGWGLGFFVIAVRYFGWAHAAVTACSA
jgi:hypothetical protein